VAVGLTPALVLAAVVVGALSLLLLAGRLPLVLALPVVVIKLALPVVYFAWFADGSWNFLDDISYWRHGQLLLEAGYEPFTVLLQREGLAMLVFLSLGPHILYSWWNHLAQFLFGPHYFAAVLMNVGLSVLSGIVLYQISRLVGMSRQYARGLLLFYLLHWEFLVWTSFINLKDVMVGALTLPALYFLLRIGGAAPGRGATPVTWVGLIAVLLVLPSIRFYIPVLLLGSYGLWVLLKRQGWKKYLILGSAAAGFFLVLPRSIPADLLEFNPLVVLVNFARVVLTPQPWSVDPAYSFLLLPSVLHWLMLGPGGVGAWLLWRRSPAAALPILYLGVITLFYAVIPEIITPRNRVQALFGWAWIQYHVLYELVLVLSNRWSERAARRAAPAPFTVAQAVP
jgi:hypothetical protein